MNQIATAQEHHLAYSSAARAEIIEHVLEQLVIGKRGLARILREDEGMPSVRTFHAWMLADENLAAQVERAREIAATTMLEEIPDIAEDVALEKNAIAKAKLRIYARETFAMKIAPKQFGNKLDLTSANKPLPAGNQLNDNRLQAIISTVAARKAKAIEDSSDEG